MSLVKHKKSSKRHNDDKSKKKKKKRSKSKHTLRATDNTGGKTIAFKPIVDKHTTYSDIEQALRQAGLESSDLIIGIDYTKSNEWTGKRTYGGRCLHAIPQQGMNPYQYTIHMMGKTLTPFDDDNLIPAYGFGDVRTKNEGVFSFYPDVDGKVQPCRGFGDVLRRYCDLTPGVQLSGPTSFVPIITQAITIVKEARSYHMLVIVCDGQVVDKDKTAAAIVQASKYPLSIICVGVGDGPWDAMEKFDDALPKRKFDNFQFVDFEKCMHRAENPEINFVVAAMQEIPEQYEAIKKLGYL